MQLYYRYFPSQSSRTIVILHGLFGSSKNWMSVAKELSSLSNIYALDLRNHGNSPHHSSHTLQDMILDLKEFLEEKTIEDPILLGHSMGGLVSMGFALDYPDRISKLIVVDIAPKVYLPHHHKEFAVLKTDVSGFQSRQEIDQYLANIHPISQVRQFLMMNLEKTKNGYRWKINVDAIEKEYYLSEISRWENQQFLKETLFIKAKDSDYIQKEDYSRIFKMFPKAKIIELEGNHWLHYTNQKEFVKAVAQFL